MWVLVLIYTVFGNAGGITLISDFSTEKACIETGKQWEANNSWGSAKYSYKCLKKN